MGQVRLTGCQLIGLRFLEDTFVSLRLGLWNEWRATVRARTQSKAYRFLPVTESFVVAPPDLLNNMTCGPVIAQSATYYFVEVERLWTLSSPGIGILAVFPYLNFVFVLECPSNAHLRAGRATKLAFHPLKWRGSPFQ
jgi:hypothetical protein